MKISNNKWLVAGVCLLLLSTSCTKKFITKVPNDQTTAEEALGTANGLQTALNGAYAQLRSISLYGRDMPIIGDLQADNTFIETDNSGRYLNQFTYRYTSSDGTVEGDWSAAYAGILDANRIIDADVPGTDAIKAEAYGIRALLYFKLINMYARPYTDNPTGLGVPLILHYDPSLLPGRDNITKVYAQIVSDLTTALKSVSDYTSSVTLSKYSIQALLARAYFYMGDYTNAKTNALAVINNGGFSLTGTVSAYQAFWNDPGVHRDLTEVLFEIDMDDVNNNGNDDLGLFVNGGYQDVYVSQQLVNLYSATDIRTSVLIPGQTKGAAAVPATLIGKYPNGNGKDKDNPKVIRLAEMYLIAAESSLPGNEADARMYLNELMAFRDPAFAGYTSSGTQLLNDIVTERRKELAFEGDRIYDLNRLKMDVVRGPVNPGSIPQILSTIPYSDYRRIFPIPLNEIQANANIAGQQNPGFQ
jgi:hypothetical protein